VEALAVIAAVLGALALIGKKKRTNATSSGAISGSGEVLPPDWNQPKPQPQPQPQPQDPLAMKVDQGLALVSSHPDLIEPAALVYTDRKIGLASNGYSYGIDIYADKVTGQNGQYIGFVYVVSNTKASSIWSYRAGSIPAVRDKLLSYAEILKGAV